MLAVVTQGVSPQKGGCWFCFDTKHQDEEKLFSGEWDTYVHESCVKEALAAHKDHPEAKVMAYEFDM